MKMSALTDLLLFDQSNSSVSRYHCLHCKLHLSAIVNLLSDSWRFYGTDCHPAVTLGSMRSGDWGGGVKYDLIMHVCDSLTLVQLADSQVMQTG